MINGYKPTRKQRKILEKNKLDAREWLTIKETAKTTSFRKRNTNETIELNNTWKERNKDGIKICRNKM